MEDDPNFRAPCPSPDWMDAPAEDLVCTRCGKALPVSYWVIHGDALHFECVAWHRLPRPPFAFREKELRKRCTQLRAELEALGIAGNALARAGEDWPNNATAHVDRIVAAVEHLDGQWPSEGLEPPADDEKKAPE